MKLFYRTNVARVNRMVDKLKLKMRMQVSKASAKPTGKIKSFIKNVKEIKRRWHLVKGSKNPNTSTTCRCSLLEEQKDGLLTLDSNNNYLDNIGHCKFVTIYVEV